MRVSLRARLALTALATGLVPVAIVAFGAWTTLSHSHPDIASGGAHRLATHAAATAAAAAAHATGTLIALKLAPWVLGAAAWAVLAACLLVLGRGRALEELHRGAEAVGRGELGTQIEVVAGADAEIARVAQIFNYMSLQLLAYESETKKLYQSLEQSYLQTMLAFTSVIESKDRYTMGHSQRVGEWAAMVGRELGLPESDVRHLLWGGVLHDIGKIGIIEPILSKNGLLTAEEMHAMRAHPMIGASIVAGIPFLRPIMPAVRHHHERWDGSGYPDGLCAEEIPLIARIVGAVDVWDACTSTRTYQEAMPAEAALEVMNRLSGTQLDPTVVAAIERVVRRKRTLGEVVSAADQPAEPRVAARVGKA